MAQEKNIFGLHLTQTSDIHQASSFINSNGGDWGYVTIVLTSDKLNYQTWQDFFNTCREKHIIPIIRLATNLEGDNWRRPTNEDIDRLAVFLNSLNWPSTPKHIILFNEPNHASEWGGEVNPQSFADISIYAYQKFKNLDPDFFILNGALDLAAPNQNKTHYSPETFWDEINTYNPNYFQSFDGLASHSYPNHGFVGTPKDTHQQSIRGFLWEINYLKRDLPVFITETGWPHREGEIKDNHFYTVKTTAKFTKDAFDIWNNYPQVKAVTPFIFNYPYPPFDHFSWLDKNENLYQEYKTILDLQKTQNQPIQKDGYIIKYLHLPFLVFTGKEYQSSLLLENVGQSIWGEKKFCIEPTASQNIKLESICVGDNKILPGQSQIIHFKFTVEGPSESSFLSWKNTEKFPINPLVPGSTIFRPKTGLLEKIIDIFK